jgi:AraC-like DNA-binding protein
MTNIAFELGFSTPVSFSKMFKQHECKKTHQGVD